MTIHSPFRVSSDGSIHKLIIARITTDRMPAVTRTDQNQVVRLGGKESLEGRPGSDATQDLEYFLVFKENFV